VEPLHPIHPAGPPIAPGHPAAAVPASYASKDGPAETHTST
jgi:hypothetical protein